MKTTPLQPGTPAPDFILPDENGNSVSLQSLRGKTVVLYFYPKDDTSGCTREACEFRDRFPKFQQQNVLVFGVSPDSPQSHQKFIAKYNLPFSLLSDESKETLQRYGVWVEKSMYGRKYMGVERTTFIIGPDGRILHLFRKVKPAEHPAEVEAFLAGIETT